MSAKALGRERSQRTAAAKAVGRWSTSARWEGCTKATAAPRIRHILRDVEEQQGFYRSHSNELIDPAMTSANFSFRPVVEADGSIRKERITSVGEVFDHMEDSLERVQRYRVVPEFRMVVEKDADGNKIPELDEAGEPVLDKKGKPVHKRRKEPMPRAGEKVPVAMRKDAVVAVEELFQLDSEYTGSIKDMTPEMRAEVQRLYDVWYADLVDQYGAHNVLCVSEHWDETSPHVSAFCMPIRERADGTAELNTKLFTTGAKDPSRTEARDAYSAKHDRLREALRDHGYEATFERITPRDAQGFAEKGVPLANFKRAAKRATAEEREAIKAERAEVIADLKAREADTNKWISESNAAMERVKPKIAEADQRLAEADRVLTSARAEAEQIKDQARAEGLERGRAEGRDEWERVDGASYRERVKAELKDEWERDEKPALVEAAKAEVENELAGYTKSRKGEIDAELADYEVQQRANMPEYDPKVAAQAMQAARFEAGERRAIPIKMKDGSTSDIKANDVLDQDAARIYARRGETVTEETVAERSTRLKGSLGKGVVDINRAGEQSADRDREEPRWR